MESRVIFINLDLKNSFENLKEIDERLFKEINKALAEIKQNVFYGRQVKKKLIPKKLIDRFGITNLWIYNLRKDWRLLYSIAPGKVEVLALILDWMNHKDYERLFKF